MIRGIIVLEFLAIQPSSSDFSMDWFKGKSNQETMDFPIKYGVETSKFSLKPIHWTSGQRLQEALGLAANYSDGRRSTTAPAMSKHLGAAAVFSGKNMGIHQWSSNYNRNIKWIVGITWEYDGNMMGIFYGNHGVEWE